LQITKSIRKSIASFVELTLPYIIASSPIKGEGKFGFSLYSIGRKIILITTI